LVETQELLASNQLTIAKQVSNLICKSWKYINIILRLYQLVNEMQYFIYLKLPLNKKTYVYMPKFSKKNLNAY
jgi:hypothetical protein